MNKTTYYNLNLVEGTDIVNPLTVDNPNYECIDEAMHDNAVAGVTLASEIANATVHALTRENSECAVIRFIATSNWKAGDTVTVDGVPVTATLPSGETLPDNAYVINANVLCILTGTNLTMYLERKKTDNATEIGYGETTVAEKLREISSALDKRWATLWSNDDTSAEFIGQQLSIDYKDYKLFAVEFSPHKTLSRGNIVLCMLGRRIPMSDTYYSSGAVNLRTRDCSAFTGAFIFYDGYVNGALNNDVCIPRAIYGVM